jgi:hypothetical protein
MTKVFRVFYLSAMLALALSATYSIAFCKGWDKGYIVGVFDNTFGGVKLEQLCDKHGHCQPK